MKVIVSLKKDIFGCKTEIEMAKKCYNCQTELIPGKQSDEHLILNAMGGRLKSKNLICKDCNSKIGSDVDGELAEQFKFLSGYLQVKRDHGAIPTTKGGLLSDGTKINLSEGVTPTLVNPHFEVIEKDGVFNYAIVARDEKQMRTLLGRVKKEHHGFKIEDGMKNIKVKNERLRTPVEFKQSFGGDLAFKSIAKTAVNFYMLKCGFRENIVHLLPYIFGDEKLNCVKHFHPKKYIYKKEPNEIVHFIHLVGDKHKRILYCYIEFFSIHSYIVLLSDDYSGKNVNLSYAYDLNSNCEIKKRVKLKFTKGEFDDLKNIPAEFFDAVKEKTQRVISIAEKKQVDNEIRLIIDKAFKDVFHDNHGDKKIITKQLKEEFARFVTEQIGVFLFGKEAVDEAMKDIW